MNYPNDYKISEMSIVKFERDYGIRTTSLLEYKFINAFPKGITSIPVAYGPADLLKVSVTFNYDRYIVKKKIDVVTTPDPSQKLPNPKEAIDYYTNTTLEGVNIFDLLPK
jgi:hypothetical protein